MVSAKLKHKEHKVTRMRTGKMTGNQIDHIIHTEEKQKPGIEDVRSYIGANACRKYKQK